MFQKRHYENIAIVLATSTRCPKVIESFCRMFEHDNPNFNRQRFLGAIAQNRPLGS